MSSEAAPTSHTLQWRTPLPEPQKLIYDNKSSAQRVELRNIQNHGSPESTPDTSSGHADEHESHVRWEPPQSSSQAEYRHDSVEEERHFQALGMSRRGSFFPGHYLASSDATHAVREDHRRSHGGHRDHSHASVPVISSRLISHEDFSAFGYHPYSLKDYRDNDYDPKQRSYWTLGTLGKDTDPADIQVRMVLRYGTRAT